MNTYTELANYYDLLMEDVDYQGWVDYIIRLFQESNIQPKKILDTACGTGNITIPLAQKGYTMWGADISQDMLTMAENKSRAAKQKIKFLNQSMSELQINETFDSILCMCDGVNYILEKDALQDFFKAAYKLLEKDGVLIFDISSYYKLHNILGNNILYEEKNNISYVWENQFDETDAILEMNLVFFVPSVGTGQEALYKKFEENHIQKAYRPQELKQSLQEAGFKQIKIYDAFQFTEPGHESDRIFFIAYK